MAFRLEMSEHRFRPAHFVTLWECDTQAARLSRWAKPRPGIRCGSEFGA